MAFSNPISITIDSVQKDLDRINQDNYGSEYFLSETDGEYRLKIRHSRRTVGSTKYDRHNIEFVHTVYAAGDVDEFNRKVYLVLENKVGDDSTAVTDMSVGYSTFIDSTAIGNLLAWSN